MCSKLKHFLNCLPREIWVSQSQSVWLESCLALAVAEMDEFSIISQHQTVTSLRRTACVSVMLRSCDSGKAGAQQCAVSGSFPASPVSAHVCSCDLPVCWSCMHNYLSSRFLPGAFLRSVPPA